jgi:hypothetical protein
MRGIRSGLISIVAIGLLAGSAIGVLAQEQGSGQVRAGDAKDLHCVRTSTEVEAERLHEAVVAEAVTITVVPDAECAPDDALDALSDAEHFGAFSGHALDVISSVTAIRAEPRTVPQAEDAETWLAELAADPDAMAANLALFDRLVAFLEDELAWLEAHPPRPCWAGGHEAWRDWSSKLATNSRSFSTALRAQDVGLLVQANADLKAIQASEAPDIFSLGRTCWALPAE